MNRKMDRESWLALIPLALMWAFVIFSWLFVIISWLFVIISFLVLPWET